MTDKKNNKKKPRGPRTVDAPIRLLPEAPSSPKRPRKKNKGFTEHQPEGSLPDFFKYVPDAYQVSDWVQDVLSRDGPPANPDGKAVRGKTKGLNRGTESKKDAEALRTERGHPAGFQGIYQKKK